MNKFWERFNNFLITLLLFILIVGTSYVMRNVLNTQLDVIQQMTILVQRIDQHQRDIYQVVRFSLNEVGKLKRKLYEPNYDLIVKSTVLISNKEKNSGGCGVCIVYKGKKYILSAYHLDDSKLMFVKDGIEEIKLRKIAGNRKIDLVLYEPIQELENAKYISFARNPNIKLGDKVWVCGNPGGVMEDTITYGIFSKILYDPLFSLTKVPMWVISAPVWFGNSGGGVWNHNGELVAILSQLHYRTGIILGMAIPIETINKFLEKLE